MKTEEEKNRKLCQWVMSAISTDPDDIPIKYSLNSLKQIIRQEIDNYLREIGCSLVEK